MPRPDCSVAKSMPDFMPKEEETENDEGSPDSTNEEESDEMNLAIFLLVEFTEFTYQTLTIGKKHIEDVAVDVNAIVEKSEALKIKTAKLIQLLNNLDQINLTDKGFGLMDKNLGRNLRLLNEIKNVWDTFNTSDTEKPSPEDLIIEDILKKHGIEKIVDDVKLKFLGFTERFYVAIDEHWNSWSPEEQIEHKMFAEWIELLKKETDIEKKITLFEKIIELNEHGE